MSLQVLFKNLNVDMKEVKPSKLLENRARELEGNPDFSNKEPIHAQPAQVASESATPYVATVPSLPQQLDLLLDIPVGSNSATTMHTSAISQVRDNTIINYVIISCGRINGSSTLSCLVSCFFFPQEHFHSLLNVLEVWEWILHIRQMHLFLTLWEIGVLKGIRIIC